MSVSKREYVLLVSSHESVVYCLIEVSSLPSWKLQWWTMVRYHRKDCKTHQPLVDVIPIDPLPLMGRRPSTKQKLKDSPLWINGNGFCCWFRLYHEYRNQPTKPWNMGITNPYPAWHIWVLWWFGSRCLECYDTIQAIELLMEMRKWYPNGTHTFLGSVGNTNTYNI